VYAFQLRADALRGLVDLAVVVVDLAALEDEVLEGSAPSPFSSGSSVREPASKATRIVSARVAGDRDAVAAAGRSEG